MRGRADTADTPRLPFTGITDGTRMASRLAAEMTSGRAEGDRAKVYRAIALSMDGATDKEIQVWLAMSGDTERPRRIELLRAGLIVDSGELRDRATVWKVAR